MTGVQTCALPIVPGGLPQYPRIYAALDPDGIIPEIHENNNKGFNVLGEQPISTGVADRAVAFPGRFALEQNYPNPFNPTTTIAFDLPGPSRVTLQVFDVLGREVGRLADNAIMQGGQHRVSFDARSLASGVYFYRLLAHREMGIVKNPEASFSRVNKMIVVR